MAPSPRQHAYPGFGARARARMLCLGLTPADLWRRLGRERRSSVYRWLDEQSAPLDVLVQYQLARVLRCHPGWLFFGRRGDLRAQWQQLKERRNGRPRGKEL